MARFRIDPSRSRVFIDATSTLHPIHSETDGLGGWLDVDVHDGRLDLAGSPRGHIEFAVDRLKSGNFLEDRELLRRIDARRYPTISGEMEAMRADDDQDADEHAKGRYVVSGALTFRGVTRRCEDVVSIDVSDPSTLLLSGQSVFDIRDFGMEPPRVLMLKVEPRVTVRIDVVASLEQ